MEFPFFVILLFFCLSKNCGRTFQRICFLILWFISRLFSLTIPNFFSLGHHTPPSRKAWSQSETAPSCETHTTVLTVEPPLSFGTPKLFFKKPPVLEGALLIFFLMDLTPPRIQVITSPIPRDFQLTGSRAFVKRDDGPVFVSMSVCLFFSLFSSSFFF